MKRWKKKLLYCFVIVINLSILMYYKPMKSYVDVVCRESLTVQRFDVAEMSCAVITLDWKRFDKVVSEMDFDVID